MGPRESVRASSYCGEMTSVGITFPPNQPPERLLPTAQAAEAAGLDDLWLWEDCFAESGIGPAGAVLGTTARLRVGIGLIPVPLRNVSVTAMELATLARMFPGRLLPGAGHGVLDWMGQVGVRAASPMTLLREYTTALRRLLDGEEVTVDGRYVRLTRVQLAWPPSDLPLLVGGVGPKTLALAGELGDGLLIDAPDAPTAGEHLATARGARAAAGIDQPYHVVATVKVPMTADVDLVRDALVEHQAAGATRISVCGMDEHGVPGATDQIRDLVDTVAQARDAVEDRAERTDDE